jgi:hypothetical protein
MTLPKISSLIGEYDDFLWALPLRMKDVYGSQPRSSNSEKTDLEPGAVVDLADPMQYIRPIEAVYVGEFDRFMQSLPV